MFAGAQDAHINGGQFVIGNVVNNNAAKDAFDLLLEHCAPSALLDSNERFDPPRCAKDTRQAIIREISEWIDTDSDFASMLWLYGSAGAGKSALGQSIAEMLKQRHRLLASFFFSRTASGLERRDGNRLVPTLVYQLTLAFPETRKQIEDSIFADPAIFDKSRQTQLECLFTKPLEAIGKRMIEEKQKPKKERQSFSLRKMFKKKDAHGVVEPKIPTSRLIVIDGLDECQGEEVQADLLKIIALAIDGLPVPIRALVASRPETHLRRTFDHPSFPQIYVHKINLDQDQDAQTDIRRFLSDQFHEIRSTHPLRQYLDPSWPPEEVINALVEKSSPQFIYASTVMRFIKFPRDRPDVRLNIVLGISTKAIKDNPFALLDALYTYIFSTIEVENRQVVWRIFGLLYLAKQSDYLAKANIGTSALQLEEVLHLSEGDIDILLDPLPSLLVVPTRRTEAIHFLHASIFDYLLDAGRSGEFCLDLGFAHGLVSERLALLEYRKLKDPRNRPNGSSGSLQLAFRFIIQCQQADLSNDLKNLLRTFDPLYNIILEPDALPEIWNSPMTMSGPVSICMLLDMLFDVFLRDDFPEGRRWLPFHVHKIHDHLSSMLRGPSVLDEKPTKYLFSDTSSPGLLQSRHDTFRAILRPFTPLRLAPSTTTEIRRRRHRFNIEQILAGLSENTSSFGNEFKPPSRSLHMHLIIMFLPLVDDYAYEPQQNSSRPQLDLLERLWNVRQMPEWINQQACSPGCVQIYEEFSEHEFERVFERTVVEYLKRIEEYLHPDQLFRWKERWGYG